MRTRNIKKQVWLNREEATLLKKKAKKAETETEAETKEETPDEK